VLTGLAGIGFRLPEHPCSEEPDFAIHGFVKPIHGSPLRRRLGFPIKAKPGMAQRKLFKTGCFAAF